MPAELTAHALAKILLAGPDLPVELDDGEAGAVVLKPDHGGAIYISAYDYEWDWWYLWRSVTEELPEKRK